LLKKGGPGEIELRMGREDCGGNGKFRAKRGVSNFRLTNIRRRY
jgi:hypothetical protein